MGLQASQKIVTGSDPLRVLRDISQNFPSLAAPLTRLKLNTTLKQEIQYNQKRIAEGMEEKVIYSYMYM
jgi:UDP-glucose:glycoprotein glucosyltransferase